MSLPFVDALKLMIAAAQTAISTDYTVYDVMQDVEIDDLPAIVISLVDSMDWNHQTTTGSFTVTVVQRADPSKDHRTNIAEHTERVYDLLSAIKGLPVAAGYLADPTYSIGQGVERMGESLDVTDSDMLMGYFTVNFGLQQA